MAPENIPFAPVDAKKTPGSITTTDLLAEFADQPTVAMQFTRRVLLTLKTNQRVMFEPGIQQVPAPIANDEFYKVILERYGVKRYDFKAAAATAKGQAATLRAKAEELLAQAEELDGADKKAAADKKAQADADAKATADAKAKKEQEEKEAEEAAKAADAGKNGKPANGNGKKS
jgi:hypothetical protein